MRRPVLMLEEDTSPGRRDAVIAACDVHRLSIKGAACIPHSVCDRLLTCRVNTPRQGSG